METGGTAATTTSGVSAVPDGAPVPQTASTTGMVYAGVGRRWVAVFLDGIILGVINLIISLPVNLITASLSHDSAMAALTVLVAGFLYLVELAISFGYAIYFIGKGGQTLGKRAMGVKVVKADGSQVTYGDAVLREVLGKMVDIFTLGIGYLMALWDPRKQALHDKIASTVVIKL